jgi:hypothetical protein
MDLAREFQAHADECRRMAAALHFGQHLRYDIGLDGHREIMIFTTSAALLVVAGS